MPIYQQQKSNADNAMRHRHLHFSKHQMTLLSKLSTSRILVLLI